MKKRDNYNFNYYKKLLYTIISTVTLSISKHPIIYKKYSSPFVLPRGVNESSRAEPNFYLFKLDSFILEPKFGQARNFFSYELLNIIKLK